MKLRKRSAALIAVGAAGAMVLTACGGGSSSNNNQAKGGGTVIYGEVTDWPENLFPLISAGNALSTANIEAEVLPQAYLIQPDFTVQYNKELFTSEPTSSVSGNSQTITYHVNPSAVWSDGTPIDVKDFDFSYRIQKSSQDKCPIIMAGGYDQIQSVAGSDNGKTVKVTVSPPFADWKNLFTGASNPLFPAHLMDKSTPDAICQELATGWPMADGLPSDISGGPWQLLKKNIDTANQTVTLTRNDKYWGTKPKLDRLIVKAVKNDPNTFVPGLKAGELNVVYPQPQLDMVDQIKKLAPNISSSINFGLSFEHLDFNTKDPQLADPKVRQAFAMALDRQEIVDQTVKQFSSDAKVLDNHIWMTNQPQYKDNAPAQYKQQNLAQAKQLLEADGYTLGSDGIYTKGGKRLSFKIDTTVNNPLRQTTIEVMIPQLKKAGIEATFNPNPDIFKGPDKPTSLVAGGFQIALYAWTSSPFVTPYAPIYQTPESASNVGQNYSRAGTPQIDALFKQLNQETDSTKQADLANQIDTLLWNQMATIPLYQKPTFMAWSSNITGPKDNPTNAGPLWNASTWSMNQ